MFFSNFVHSFSNITTQRACVFDRNWRILLWVFYEVLFLNHLLSGDVFVAVYLQVQQESDDEKAHLQVSQATRLDSGLYEARVQNELGYETSTFSVNVLGIQEK